MESEECGENGESLWQIHRVILINSRADSSAGRGSFNSSNGKLFILICVAADDTKSKTDKQRERETKDKRLPHCLAVPTVAQWGGWEQHRKRANKLYISNFMNSCWNGKRNGNRRGKEREREREIGRGQWLELINLQTLR